jgi:hypothetical protein
MSISRTRLGFHYFPDDRHFTRSDADAWLPVLTSLEAGWLVLRAGAEKAVPESFLKAVLDSGIEPVLHLPARVGSLHEDDLGPLLTSYARWGVRYVVVFDRPNLRASWESSEWSRGGLVERFLDRALPILRLTEASGLAPVLPPLEPGGDYWDTAFLEAALASLLRRGEQALLEHMCLGVYAWTHDHPLNWGAGGPNAWPEARPYLTPAGSQDQRGFRVFDWYSAIASRVLEHDLPMLVIAGGAMPPRGRSPLLGDPYGEQNAEIVRALQGEDFPASALNFAFYLLSAEDTSPDAHAAWFTAPDAPRPWVEAVRRSIRAGAKAARPLASRSIAHYLLLPTTDMVSLASWWDALLPFIADGHPVIGFSPREARSAERVTLVGGPDELPLELEDDLREAGCRVARVRLLEPADASLKEGAFDERR